MRQNYGFRKKGKPVFFTTGSLISEEWKIIKKSETSKDKGGFTLTSKP